MFYEDAITLWQSYKIASVDDLDLHLDSFRVLFAYNSGKIENESISYHDTRAIFDGSKVNGYTGDTRAIFEQQNQKLCYQFLKNKIIAREPINIESVKEIHRILVAGTYDERRYIVNEERPGEFKKHDYVTGFNEVGSDAEDVEQDLSELLSELNEDGNASPLKSGAYFHAAFEYIHPFADGNGRVGRTLLNYWLMINNHPPIIIYDEDKTTYYTALQAYDEEESLEMLINFLKQETLKTWENTLLRASGVKKNRKGYK